MFAEQRAKAIPKARRSNETFVFKVNYFEFLHKFSTFSRGFLNVKLKNSWSLPKRIYGLSEPHSIFDLHDSYAEANSYYIEGAFYE